MTTNHAISEALLDEMLREQLKAWPLAAENYAALGKTERRRFKIGALEGAFQCNPKRIGSTGAKVDKAAIAARPCFLCSANRPKEQYALPFTGSGGQEWEILVNPYPILPFHFTVAAKEHKPQESVPLDMIEMAERLPRCAVFFNGARAGASAPDHEHCQIVLSSELPLLRYLEEKGDDKSAIEALPYRVEYYKVTPDLAGMEMLRAFSEAHGYDREAEGRADEGLVNVFAWMGRDGMLRLAVVPRSAHRPSCYNAEREEDRLMVSPGAIDMAGLVILPRKEDFDKISETDLAKIWEETAVKS